MLFGHGKVSERVHLMATFFVAFGTTLSRVLDPGAELVDADARRPRDRRRRVPRRRAGSSVIFNPSFPYRFTHMLLASALTCAFLLAGLSRLAAAARRRRSARRRSVLRVGLTLAALLIPLQIFVGDLHGLNTLRAPAGRRSPRWKACGRPSAARRCCCSRCPTRASAQQPLRDRGARSCASLILTPRPRRRDQGPERLPRRAPAGAAGVLRLPRDGRHGRADAGHELARLVAATGARGWQPQRLPRALLWLLRRR